jgi:hypothetical protein
MLNWLEEAIRLSSDEVGWHLSRPDNLDQFFTQSPKTIVEDIICFLDSGIREIRDYDNVVVNDVFAYFQGPGGPIHFIKDKNITNDRISAAFRAMESPFREIFSSDDITWSSAWTWWDSFITYSNDFVDDDSWENRDYLIDELRSTARKVASICRSGEIALEMSMNKHNKIIA